jgi:hypothetical protein
VAFAFWDTTHASSVATLDSHRPLVARRPTYLRDFTVPVVRRVGSTEGMSGDEELTIVSVNVMKPKVLLHWPDGDVISSIDK